MPDPEASPIDALVIGAGPVGLAMASELARHGVTCRIIDQDDGPTDQSRALGVQARTLEVFEDMGVIAPALERGKRVHGLNAYADGRRIVHLGFDLEGFEAPYPFVLILPQSQTEHILIDHLSGQGLAVERRSRLAGFTQDDEGVTATVAAGDGGSHAIRARRLIGCDGARSAVRHILGLSFEGAEYEETFLLADVRVDWDVPDDEIHFFPTAEGPIGAFPMNEAGRWRLIDGTGVDQSDDPARAVARFQSILRAQGHPGVVVRDPTWVSSFRIHRRVAGTFRAGRCFVAGDAAHIHSPAGGQGMNTGIQDAYNLAWKLGLVAAGAAPDALLDSYTAERRPVVADVLRGTDWLTRAMTLRSPVAESIRNHLAATLSEFDFVQRRISRGLSELGVGYRDTSPIVAEDRASLLQSIWPIGRGPGFSSYLDFGAAPHPGERVPDVALHPAQGGRPRRLFEVLHGTRHKLLIFEGATRGDDDRARLNAVARLIRDRFPAWIEAVYVAHSEAATRGLPDGVATLFDPAGLLHGRFGASSDCLYLVRPDGYVGYRAQPADAGKLAAYLGRIFA